MRKEGPELVYAQAARYKGSDGKEYLWTAGDEGELFCYRYEIDLSERNHTALATSAAFMDMTPSQYISHIIQIYAERCCLYFPDEAVAINDDEWSW